MGVEHKNMLRVEIFTAELHKALRDKVNKYLFDYKISKNDLVDIKYMVVDGLVDGEFSAMIIHNVKTPKFKLEEPEEKREYKINNNH